MPHGLLYCRVKPADVPEIIDETFIEARVVKRLMYQEPQEILALPTFRDLPFFAKQIWIALHNCGSIDPDKIDEYIARDGYRGLGKVLVEMSPENVIQEVKDSGLRGRGGGGFLTGQKWEFCRKSPGTIKYVICNADEGDPGAFMDRSILESDPHSVLEGMTIAGYAIGAAQGFIYCREEYPLAIQRLNAAIEQARDVRSARREHPRQRIQLRHPAQGRRRRLRLRRRDRSHCLHRRPARRAATPPALPGRQRPLGQAQQYQQRQELRHDAPDHSERRQVVQLDRLAQVARHGHLRSHRQGHQHRAGRGAHGHLAGRHRL